MADEYLTYDQDVAPQTTSFFRGLANDRFIEPEDRRRVAGNFFNDVSQIRQVRQRNQLFPYKLAGEALGLEAARFNLDRARKEADDEDRVSTMGSMVDDELSGILDDEFLSPDEKASAVQRAHFNALRKLPPSAAGSASWLSRTFGSALNVVKPTQSSAFTPSQIARGVQDGVPAEVFDTQDPAIIGKAMADAAERKRLGIAKAEEDKAAELEARRSLKAHLDALDAVTDIEFAEDPNTLKPDPTKFRKGDIVIPRIKRALNSSPDPAIRKLAKDAGDDPAKLRDAYQKAADAAASGPVEAARTVLPPRP